MIKYAYCATEVDFSLVNLYYLLSIVVFKNSAALLFLKSRYVSSVFMCMTLLLQGKIYCM